MAPRKTLTLIVLVFGLFASACGSSADVGTTAAAPTAADDDADTTTTVAETTTIEEATTVAETTTVEETTTSADEPAEAVEVDAATIFEDNCARCHGSDGSGGRGASLIGIVTDHPEPLELVDLVTNGTPKMPSFGGKLSDAEIEAVSEYARTNF